MRFEQQQHVYHVRINAVVHRIRAAASLRMIWQKQVHEDLHELAPLEELLSRAEQSRAAAAPPPPPSSSPAAAAASSAVTYLLLLLPVLLLKHCQSAHAVVKAAVATACC
jgi:hypothetical protein